MYRRLLEHRRFLPLVTTVGVLAAVLVIAQLVSAAPATPAPRATEAPVVVVAETPSPTPTEAPTPEPTVAPTEEPPPPPTPAPTRPPTPRPTAPPPPPPPPPNPGGLGIGGRVTDQFGGGYGGVCVTIGPPIRCATTTAPNGTYYVSLDSAPPGIAWDLRYLVGGTVRVERLGVVVSGPVTLNVTIPR